MEKENRNKEIQANKLFICVYDKDKIGLFKQESYTQYKWNIYTGEKCNMRSYIIYQGVDSDHTGIFINGKSRENGYSIVLSNASTYASTCQINEVMSYNDLRFQMYTNSDINDIDIDFKYTNSKEIAKVLIFAHKLLDKENLKQNRKIKR